VLIAQRPILTEEVVSEYRSRFIIEPLEPGFGYTLGNSIRRPYYLQFQELLLLVLE